MTLRDDLLPVFDEVRPLLDELGFRLYTITMRLSTWDGGRPGLGAESYSESFLTLDAAGSKVKVKRMSTQAAIAGGYNEGSYLVGPFTPEHDGYGRTFAYLDPPLSSPASEVLYHLEGPEVDGWFRKRDSYARTFGYYLVLEATGANPNG